MARNAVHRIRKLGGKTQHVSRDMVYQYYQVHGARLPGAITGVAGVKGILLDMRSSTQHLDLAYRGASGKDP
jgi:hypothetical protein